MYRLFFSCLMLLSACLAQLAWASERAAHEGRQSAKPGRGEYWPYAPWRNDEPQPGSASEAKRRGVQQDRFRDIRRDYVQPVSDHKAERQRLSPEARRELRQQIHEASKELYR